MRVLGRGGLGAVYEAMHLISQRAEAMIDEEVERFLARLQTADVVPTIVSLQDHLETIRQAEKTHPLHPRDQLRW